MGFFRDLFSVNKLNADPDQQALAQLFIDYAEDRKPWEDIFTFLEKHRWPRAKRENRIVHALSMIRASRVDLYPAAKELGQLIITGARRPAGSPAAEAISQTKERAEMEKLSEQVVEETGKAIVDLLGKKVRTIEGGIELLSTCIFVLMKRLPPKEQEEMRQVILNGFRNYRVV